MRTYYVYIMANKNRRIYAGVTNDIDRRTYEHKAHEVEGFTKKYNIDRLVYFEEYGEVWDAIAREKQIKSWRREKKVWLIETVNPNWDDWGSDEKWTAPMAGDPSTPPPPRFARSRRRSG